jgi:hypothetical protein
MYLSLSVMEMMMGITSYSYTHSSTSAIVR